MHKVRHDLGGEGNIGFGKYRSDHGPFKIKAESIFLKSFSFSPKVSALGHKSRFPRELSSFFQLDQLSLRSAIRK